MVDRSPLKTASWWTPLPPNHVRIAISRGPLPPRTGLSTMRYAALTPQWAPHDTPPDVFHRHYLNRLANLDPEHVFADIVRMGGARVPVLCCYESVRDIRAGVCGCHRHLAAAWFERHLDIRCEEVGAPDLERFTYWNAHPILPAPPGERPRTDQPISTRTKSARVRRSLQQLKLNL